jgi:hypothetical protein
MVMVDVEPLSLYAADLAAIIGCSSATLELFSGNVVLAKASS